MRFAVAQAAPVAGDLPATYDTYVHLLPGNEAEAADLLDAYVDAERG